MKKLYYLSLLNLILGFSFSELKSQSFHPENKYAKYPSRLFIHYSETELKDLKENFPADYEMLQYYHLNSYTISIIDSSLYFNSDSIHLKFDITRFEQHRELNVTSVLNFEKYGFQLSLFPYNQLIYLTPLQEIFKAKLEE